MSDSAGLNIRGLHTDDWESLYLLLTNPGVLLDTVELPYAAEEPFRERFNNPPATLHTLIAETGQPSGRRRIIGAAWLQQLENRRRHVGQLSFVVHPDYRGSEAEISLLQAALDMADRWLGLRRIEATAFVENAAAIALLERHGFEREAVLRCYALRDGRLSDAVLLARLHKGGQRDQKSV